MDLKSSITAKIKIEHNSPLSKWTTFQLGGSCKTLIHCTNPNELEEIILDLNTKKKKFIVIGGGSNLVVSDHGINCIVVRYFSETPLIDLKDNVITVSGSTVLDQLALIAAQQALEGVNYTSGIPGTVGGAIIGNAGAFGQQIGDVVQSVTVLSLNGIKRKLTAKEIDFSYRHSSLKESGEIVLEAQLKVTPSDKNTLLNQRAEILKTRAEKHPNLKTLPCAGSFFRNIEPTSKAGKRQATGWFLDKAGGRNLSSGGACIFKKHANIIVKGENCTAQDVYNLHQKMSALIKEKFDIDLVREVRFVGEFDNAVQSQKIIW